MRDTSIPGYRTTLDGIANTVITQVNQLQQTGYTSTGSAPTGIDFFTGTGIKDMAVNPAIQSDATQVATAKSANSPGDGTNALAMADLKDALTMAGGTATINQSYSNFITQIGSDTASAQNENSINTSVNSTLQSKWQSLSGVSLDEEMTNLIMYQHAYDASTKVMKVQDDMLQSLIDMMATV
jgi:flagellar hook-associated protein 1 FlgK